jgi:AraC-like DNA-binding protein
MVRGSPSRALRGKVSAYYGYREETGRPIERREGPGHAVIVCISFGQPWQIDGERYESFVAGLHTRQVATRHEGLAFGMQVDLAPAAAHVLLRERMDGLAERKVHLAELLDPELVDRLHAFGSCSERFAHLDEVFVRLFAEAPPVPRDVAWAWERLVGTGGQERIGDLVAELGWSRKRIAARFREEVGLTPKAAARLIRFECARAAALAGGSPDWAQIALECGYYDQSHLVNDFRVVASRPPETFFQDEAAEDDLLSAA